jgi:cyclase
MLKRRLIAVVIISEGGVVQSVRFKHTNKIHSDAVHAIENFNRWSVDELILINVSRDEASKEQFLEITEHVSAECFVPLTVGGWIDNFDYGAQLVKKGADKLILNTAIHSSPELVTHLAEHFGSQAVVASIDVATTDDDQKKVAVDRGRLILDEQPQAWATLAQYLGAGEIFFNSIQFDGARKGFDLESLTAVCQVAKVPVIAFGGAFRWKHFVEGVEAGADAVAAANIFHYTEHSTKYTKRHLLDAGVPVRLEGVI